MKTFGFLLLTTLVLSACGTKKAAELEKKLPKDVALMPERDYSQRTENQRIKDEQEMLKLKMEIEDIIALESCQNPEHWRISSLGSKPCGGPAMFIGYPVKLETDILPKITEYNRRSSAYNLKYGIISDCDVVPSPSGIKCE
ncbi:MAG: hypothetical protein Q4G16_06135, partial [Cruoricaptor ignavus]|nr:hypothetical protein [Cruoricaptor ignavus]